MIIDITDETVALLSYLEQRGMTEGEACTVLAAALESLIADPTMARAFIRVMASKLNVNDELRRPQ
jgi:hypothetical protein